MISIDFWGLKVAIIGGSADFYTKISSIKTDSHILRQWQKNNAACRKCSKLQALFPIGNK